MRVAEVWYPFGYRGFRVATISEANASKVFLTDPACRNLWEHEHSVLRNQNGEIANVRRHYCIVVQDVTDDEYIATLLSGARICEVGHQHRINFFSTNP